MTLARGEQTTFAGYVLRYEGQRVLSQPQRTVLVADVAVSRGGRSVGGVTPSLNQYPGGNELIGTPSIRWGVTKDLYASVIAFEGLDGESATFRFFDNPGVMWLWVGGAIVAIGGLVAAWPGRRRLPVPPPMAAERRLAEVG